MKAKAMQNDILHVKKVFLSTNCADSVDNMLKYTMCIGLQTIKII